MTISDVLSYVRSMMNEDSAIQPNWTDAELFRLIEKRSNEAVSILGLIEAKDTSLTSTSGTADYSYPSNVIRIRRVLYANRPLKYLNLRQFEARQPTGVAVSGTPREYSLWNNVITLIPTPNVTSDQITLYAEKKQSAITSTSSTIDVPAVFHGAICDGVLGDMFAKDLNNALMDRYENKWNNIHIPAMMKFVARKRRVGSPIVIMDNDSTLETEFGII